jgi:hypothetical protein
MSSEIPRLPENQFPFGRRFLGFGLGVLGNRHRMDANARFLIMNGRFSTPDSERQQRVGDGHVAGG